MRPAPSSFLTHDEATAFNAMAKFINGDLEWKNLPIGSIIFLATGKVYNEKDETIPGLTVELYYNRTIVPGQYKFGFTLFALRGIKRLRSYQLQVIPPDRVGHRDGGAVIMGSHEHIGEGGFHVDDEAKSFGEDHEKWFRYFLNKANITYNGKYGEPNPPDPQKGLFEDDML